MRVPVWTCLALALSILPVPQARAEPVALTFDDIPTLALDQSPAYARTTTLRLLRGLERRHMPATGFVIGDPLEEDRRAAGERLLTLWLRAGMSLGNHTWSHESLNRTPLADYVADVERDDALLRPLLRAHGQAPRWFRHPYLETGATLEDKRAFEAWLGGHGYRVAPVTLENSDYLFSPVYDDALRRHDRRRAAQVRRAYLAYAASVTRWYRAAGLELLGRRPALVFLLHASRLNADCLGGLAAILHAEGLRPVSLDVAMADPAYARSDDYADPDGDEWFSRWAHLDGRELDWDHFPEPPADIAAESQRLDPG